MRPFLGASVGMMKGDFVEVLLIPTFTGDNSPTGYLQVGNGERGAGEERWRVFDRNTATYWYNDVIAPTGTYIGIAFPSLAARTLTKFDIVTDQPGQAPLSFKMQGTLDNSTWTDIQSYTTTWGVGTGQTQTFNVSVPAVYKGFRLLYTITTSDGTTGFNELRLWGYL